MVGHDALHGLRLVEPDDVAVLHLNGDGQLSRMDACTGDHGVHIENSGAVWDIVLESIRGDISEADPDIQITCSEAVRDTDYVPNSAAILYPRFVCAAYKIDRPSGYEQFLRVGHRREVDVRARRLLPPIPFWSW